MTCFCNLNAGWDISQTRNLCLPASCKNPSSLSIQKRQRQIWSVWPNKVDIKSLSAVACALIPAPVFLGKGTLGAVTEPTRRALETWSRRKEPMHFQDTWQCCVRHILPRTPVSFLTVCTSRKCNILFSFLRHPLRGHDIFLTNKPKQNNTSWEAIIQI